MPALSGLSRRLEREGQAPFAPLSGNLDTRIYREGQAPFPTWGVTQAGGGMLGQFPQEQAYPGARPATSTTQSAYPGARPNTGLGPTYQTSVGPGTQPTTATRPNPQPLRTSDPPTNPFLDTSRINRPAGGAPLVPQTSQPGGAIPDPSTPGLAAQPAAAGGVGSYDNSYEQARQALGAGWTQDDATIAANFDRLMRIDPFVARQYAEINAPWFQRNQMQVKEQFFGGDPQKYNTWINTNSSGGYSNRDRTNADVQKLLLTTLPNGGAGAGATTGAGGTGSAGTGTVATGATGATGTTGTGTTGGVEPAPGETGGPLSSLAGDNYPLDIAKFLDPAMEFRIKQATEAAQTSAAARGNLQSGSTIQAINDRANNIAGEEWQNAYQRADADRRFAHGVDVSDRDFTYQSLRDDRDYKFNVYKYNTDSAYREKIDNRDFEFNVHKYNTDAQYRADVDNRNFNFDVEKYNADAAYREQIDNREFAFNAARYDSEHQYRQVTDLIKFGLEAVRTGAMTNIELARLINSNLIGIGNAGAAGTLGQNTSITQGISDILAILNANGARP